MNVERIEFSCRVYGGGTTHVHGRCVAVVETVDGDTENLPRHLCKYELFSSCSRVTNRHVTHGD